ncbi:lipoprotein LpqV [Mycobacterium sp. WMMD1722]|uniref:lipoprotein LpqV n=1 Tax=Mycobacterium sp. WMMD1722 TaxID=3404117 RepID=UPI003BF54F26
MRRHPIGRSATVALAAGLALTGCSSGGEEAAQTPSSSATTTVTQEETRSAAPGAVEVSPGGVTTAVGAPAESTEDEYFQACNAARVWMTDKPGDQQAKVESYLADVQSTDAAGPGTFGSPWSALAPGRQSAVIVAVEAAAAELCG